MTAERSTAAVLDAALRVRETARSAADGTAGADAVLAALAEVMEYDHASLTRWDPLRRRHTTLAGDYPYDATAYIETRLHEDPVFAVLREPGRGGLWMRDVPRPLLAASPGFREVLRPLGVEDGVAQCLFSADGRYVGMLNVSTRRPRSPRDPARAVVTLLTESLAMVTDSFGRPAAEAGRTGAYACPGGLSPRERQVLAELTGGHTNREIAARLHITPRTVATHVEHILAKLGLPNRAAAAARAAAWGLEPAP
ncbi:LuxR C-terminal-related transcriptional regulator [Streptomyces sp. NPDC053755]|uniref:helix-turn-helix transcriptional regulator n=1 Tax=Streptomyces sp. NPDC053755 TaxID=3155815 RepID=UPI003412D6EF